MDHQSDLLLRSFDIDDNLMDHGADKALLLSSIRCLIPRRGQVLRQGQQTCLIDDGGLLYLKLQGLNLLAQNSHALQGYFPARLEFLSDKSLIWVYRFVPSLRHARLVSRLL